MFGDGAFGQLALGEIPLPPVTVKVDVGTGSEFYKSVTADTSPRLEYLTPVRSDIAVQNEKLGSVQSDSAGQLEKIAGVMFKGHMAAQLETLTGVGRDHGVGIEFSGAVTAIAHGGVLLESLASIRKDVAGIPLEIATGIGRDVGAMGEALAGISARVAFLDEFLGNVRWDFISPIESMTGVGADVASRIENLGSVQIDTSLGSEFLFSLQFDNGIQVEFTSAQGVLTAHGATQIEIIASVRSDTLGLLETLPIFFPTNPITARTIVRAFISKTTVLNALKAKTRVK